MIILNKTIMPKRYSYAVIGAGLIGSAAKSSDCIGKNIIWFNSWQWMGWSSW